MSMKQYLLLSYASSQCLLDFLVCPASVLDSSELLNLPQVSSFYCFVQSVYFLDFLGPSSSSLGFVWKLHSVMFKRLKVSNL